MKKWHFILGMVLLCLLTGCSVEKLKTEKLRDLDFTVLSESEIPKELAEVIDEKKKNVFKITYEDQGYLYIAEGYGKQETSGYSIEVDSLYETENAVYVRTNLFGPEPGEKIVERVTFPYIVLKTESIDKHVVFR